MNEPEKANETLLAALRLLEAQWSAKAEDADLQGRHLSMSNMQKAYYQRGLVDGLKLALADLQKLLNNEQPDLEPSVEPEYAYVTREAALALLGQFGLHVSELHHHEDHTFSAILPPLQVFAFEERLEKLRATADIVILAKGKLPNSNKSYVDFAFTSPYSP